MTGDDPFKALGLPARADLTDDEVRAAWRRIAAVTHPDLPDGGDESRFAAAAAAYALLRTGYGRGEAYADLRGAPAGVVSDGSAVADVKPASNRRRRSAHGAPLTAHETAAGFAPTTASSFAPALARLLWRVRHGRPAILAVRFLIAGAVCWAGVAAAGWQPATLAIVVGSLTWLIRTTR
ncbi:MAG TPA: J domain-containing protein [Streptosporangiaceae bacterium]